MEKKSADAVGLKRPHQPQGEKHYRHRAGHVQVRIAAAQQWTSKMKRSIGRVMTPADCSHAGDETKPVYEQDEDENRSEEPKRFLHQIRADNASQEIVE